MSFTLPPKAEGTAQERSLPFKFLIGRRRQTPQMRFSVVAPIIKWPRTSQCMSPGVSLRRLSLSVPLRRPLRQVISVAFIPVIISTGGLSLGVLGNAFVTPYALKFPATIDSRFPERVHDPFSVPAVPFIAMLYVPSEQNV